MSFGTKDQIGLRQSHHRTVPESSDGLTGKYPIGQSKGSDPEFFEEVRKSELAQTLVLLSAFLHM